MRLIAPLVMTALLLPVAPLRAAETPAPAPATAAVPADIDASLRRAEVLGERLLHLDRAAWVASDQMMAASGGRGDPRVRGWITDEHEGGIDVIFIDATPSALYRVAIDGEGRPTGPVDAEPPALTPAQVVAARALAAASLAAPPSCSGTYNPIVMPGDDPLSAVVYMIPGSTDANRLPVGGAWRFDVRDGEILSRRSFTNSCIAIESPREAGAAYITHLLDPVPTEIHVFWSRWSGKPMGVSTERGAWMIRDGHIQALPNNAQDAADASQH